MATVLEEYTTEDQRSVVLLLWEKWLNAKDIHKEIFLAGSAYRLKRFTAGSRNVANISLMTKWLKLRC
jgi:hypothetical protein